jgi:hypothetical protein
MLSRLVSTSSGIDMRVKITRPDLAGRYNLCYALGEVVELPDAQAKELIEEKYAEATKEPVGHFHERYLIIPDKETAESKAKPEKR